MTAMQLPPNTKIGWAPNSAIQAAFLACPVFEVLLHGSRGGGKTMVLLADYAQHVGQGFGDAWRGVIFRRQARDLDDLIAKSRRMLTPLFPDATFIGGNTPEWRFATGEVLMFRHIKDEHDYAAYHGFEIPFVGFEEATQWITPGAYESMMTCCRSSVPNMPRKYRATTNPSGPGHSWLKRRFIDAAPAGKVIQDETGRARVHLRLMLQDNPDLMTGDPEYIKSLKQLTDPNKRKAWLEGSWDITSGGMFDDLWDRNVHVVEPFDIPSSWRIDRAFDWGSAKPFSVGWFAESDGTGGGGAPIVPRGTLYEIGEWYGSTGKPNEGMMLPDAEIARGIIKREKELGIAGRVKPGPADNMIFPRDNNSDSIAATFERVGVRFIPADKSPGSRERGWELLRRRLSACLPRFLPDGTPDPAWRMEEPGIFIFNRCHDTIRTVPTLPRDDKKILDVDTDAEDHAADMLRYRLTSTHKPATTQYVAGMF